MIVMIVQRPHTLCTPVLVLHVTKKPLNLIQ